MHDHAAATDCFQYAGRLPHSTPTLSNEKVVCPPTITRSARIALRLLDTMTWITMAQNLAQNASYAIENDGISWNSWNDVKWGFFAAFSQENPGIRSNPIE
jgi:hypothetical protein